jgi:hypothetical protein
MCHYRFYIFMGCGHSTFSSTPVSYCADAIDLGKHHAQEAPAPTKFTAEPEIAVNELALDPSQSTVAQPTQDSHPTTPLGENIINTTKEPSTKPKSKKIEMQPCRDGRVHPLHTVRLERMICEGCASARDERLHALESNTSEIRIEPSRWQWKYHGQSRGPPLSIRNSVVEKSPAVVAKTSHSKVDSGVWLGAMGAMMKDWKGAG